MDQEDFNFSTEKYLKRIGYTQKPEISIDCLTAIHRAHLRSVPFENFDICLKRAISLEPAAIFEKLVVKKRGGYCFETNGLFLMALKALGFNARALLGRVHVHGPPTGKSHQISLVTIGEQQWLLDVGFGGSTPPLAIPLQFDQSFGSGETVLRLVKHELYGSMLQAQKDGEWNNFYSFEMNHVCAGDIDYGNYYTSTNPGSFFTTARVAAIRTESGVTTLLNHTLKIQSGGEVIEERQVEEGQVYLDMLRETFGIDLGASYDSLKPL